MYTQHTCKYLTADGWLTAFLLWLFLCATSSQAFLTTHFSHGVNCDPAMWTTSHFIHPTIKVCMASRLTSLMSTQEPEKWFQIAFYTCDTYHHNHFFRLSFSFLWLERALSRRHPIAQPLPPDPESPRKSSYDKALHWERRRRLATRCRSKCEDCLLWPRSHALNGNWEWGT